MISTCLLSIIFFFLTCLSATASDFRLAFPVDCILGEDCIIQNYVDVDAGEEWHDYNCGFLTYDGHKGTDIRIQHYQAMNKGVAVRAASDGVVLGIRNNVDDRKMDEAYTDYLKSVSGKECGNGLVVVHDDNYQTQYCHMRKGSVAVKVGDRVKEGDFLGYIGLSGKTQFPHLHISLRLNKKVISPFVGTCSTAGQYLWKDDIPYTDTQLLKLGFADAAPSLDSIEAGTAVTLNKHSAAFLFWANVVGIKKGDEQEITIIMPDEKILVHKTQIIKKSKVNWLSYVGKKRPGDGWRSGLYRAVYLLKRDGSTLIEKEVQTIIH